MYINSFGITLLFVTTVLGIIYTIFFRKVESFFNANLHCIMVVGGRTFFESIPSNILTMILIGASLYLIGVIFIYGRNIGTTTLSGIFLYSQPLFVTTLLSYWRSRLSDYTINGVYNQTVNVTFRVVMQRLIFEKKELSIKTDLKSYLS
jgi:hypothetical protein